MDTPFVYGRIAENKNFTDREEETRLLMQNFNNLINTIIISPYQTNTHKMKSNDFKSVNFKSTSITHSFCSAFIK